MNETIKTKTTQFVNWVEEHKVQIIVTGISLGLICLGLKKLGKASNDILEAANAADGGLTQPIEVPEGLKHFGVEAVDSYAGGKTLEFMTAYAGDDGNYPNKVADIGKLIEGIKALPGVTDESDVWAMISVSAKPE